MLRILGLLTIILIINACSVEESAEEIDLSGPEKSYKMSLMLDDVAIDGDIEISQKIKDNPLKEIAILDEPAPTLKRDSTYTMKVLITDHLGKTADMTKSDRVKFHSFGCLTIEREGKLIVRPSGPSPCHLPDMPQLMIGVARADDSKLILNEYLFKVVD